MQNEKKELAVVTNAPAVLTDNISTSTADVEFKLSLFQNSEFQNALATIPSQVEACEQYLASYREDPDKFIEETNEEDIDALIKSLSDSLGLKKPFDESRQMIRKGVNQMRDQLVEYYDSILSSSGFGKLLEAEKDMKDMKRLLEERRKELRWEEIHEVFDSYFETARGQLLKQRFPRLTDFASFQNRYSKMVSGARTRNVTNADKNEVRQILGTYSDGADMLIQNPWGIGEPYYTQLIHQFEADPAFDTLNARGQAVKTQEIADAIATQKRKDAELARKKAEEERLRAEREKAEKLKAEKGKSSNMAVVKPQVAPVPRPDVMNHIPEIIRYKYPAFCKYIEGNKKYWQLHVSENQKAALIYEAVTQMTDTSNPDNPYRDLVNPSNFLEFVRFVLDC